MLRGVRKKDKPTIYAVTALVALSSSQHHQASTDEMADFISRNFKEIEIRRLGHRLTCALKKLPDLVMKVPLMKVRPDWTILAGKVGRVCQFVNKFVADFPEEADKHGILFLPEPPRSSSTEGETDANRDKDYVPPEDPSMKEETSSVASDGDREEGELMIWTGSIATDAEARKPFEEDHPIPDPSAPLKRRFPPEVQYFDDTDDKDEVQKLPIGDALSQGTREWHHGPPPTKKAAFPAPTRASNQHGNQIKISTSKVTDRRVITPLRIRLPRDFVRRRPDGTAHAVVKTEHQADAAGKCFDTQIRRDAPLRNRSEKPEGAEGEPHLPAVQEMLTSFVKMIQEQAEQRRSLQKIVEEAVEWHAVIERRLDELKAGQMEILKAFQNKGINHDGNREQANSSEVQIVKEEVDEENGEQLRRGEVVVAPDGETYTIIRKLGSGGFGQVHRVKDSQRRKFALKLSPMVLLSPEMIATETAMYAAMEGKACCRFISARYLPFEATVRGTAFRCEKMDLCKIDIFDALNDDLHFELDEILKVVGQTCSGLAFINRLGFIHSDIKPDNLMFTNFEKYSKDGKKYARPLETRLIDFNVVFRKNTEGPEVFRGQSFPYMAPEMALGMPCDGRIDLWSLGLIAMQMLQLPNGGFFLADEQGHENVSSMEAALLGEVEALVAKIPSAMKRQSMHAAFRESPGFPRLISPSRRYQWTLADALKRLGDGRASVKFKEVIRSLLQVDVNIRPIPSQIARQLGVDVF